MADNLSKLIQDGKIPAARANIIHELEKDCIKESFTVRNIINKLGISAQKLYVPDDGKNVTMDKSQWTHKYWTNIYSAELSNNFSEKKLYHAIEVMEYLREKKDPEFMPINSGQGEKGHSSTGKSAAVGASAGIIIGGAVGGIVRGALTGVAFGIFRGALVGGVVGACIGGAAGYMLKKN